MRTQSEIPADDTWNGARGCRWCLLHSTSMNESKPLPTTGVCIGKEVAYEISTSDYRSDVKLHLVRETTDNRSVVSEQQLFCPMRTTGVWLQLDTTIKCCGESQSKRIKQQAKEAKAHKLKCVLKRSLPRTQ